MEKKFNGFKDLIVWQKAYELSLLIYRKTASFPRSETYGLVSQLRRCSVSVPSNISEGYERKGSKEYQRFLNIAKGSLGELETQILLAKDLGYIKQESWKEIDDLRQETMRTLRGLIKSLYYCTTSYYTTNKVK
ncbi:MAG: four helix bundle protein [Candidatus Margulisbacteria bacterium]|nr:four helix bundle protein [Candidatus Margulisiibacteriota bacterium]